MASFSLSDTLSDMQTHMAALEKAPVQQKIPQRTGEDAFHYFARVLDQIRTVILELPSSAREKIEIEARLGIFCHSNRGEDERAFPHYPGAGALDLGEGGGVPPVRFFSGVTQGAFEKMKSSIAALGGDQNQDDIIKVEDSQEVTYSYGDKRRIRCALGANKGILEEKRKILEANVAFPSANYDLRLMVSVENEENAEQVIVKGWESRRTKLRTSFTDRKGNLTLGPWCLDFTSVTSEDIGHFSSHEEEDGGGRKADSSSEVELELSKEAMLSWCKLVGEEADRETSRLASRLLDSLKRLNPMEIASPGNILAPLSGDQRGGGGLIQEAIRQRCMAILQGSGSYSKSMKFPGTMPVNLCRKDMMQVQQGLYWLAEKTDGVRYLFFVLPQPCTSILVDRSMAFYAFPGDEAYARIFPPGTVLDGELVYNLLTSSYIFLVFDILFWGEEAILQAPFRERLLTIHQRVLPTYEKAVAREEEALTASNHLRLVGKKFYRRSHIARLFARVSEEEGHRVYRDDGCISTYLRYLVEGSGDDNDHSSRQQSERECLARYYHKTDGIVFQPDRPYQCSTDLHFFKWKWLDTVTIDFNINPGPPYRVSCGGPGGQLLDLTKQVRLEAADLMRLRADMNATRCRIAECGFSAESGFWTYKMLRQDKSDPNYFTTVCTTMLELAESIEEEELQYRMMVEHSAQDDWSTQVHKMRKKALNLKLRNFFLLKQSNRQAMQVEENGS